MQEAEPDGKKTLEIDSSVFPGMQGGPLMHVIAGKAVAFGEASRPEFEEYQQQVLTQRPALAGSAHGTRAAAGLRRHGQSPDAGGSAALGITGKKAETRLDAAGIIVNKNMIPFDPRKPADPSGLRLGTPALTTRGLKETDMAEVARLIVRTLKTEDEAGLTAIRSEVRGLAGRHPIYVGWPWC